VPGPPEQRAPSGVKASDLATCLFGRLQLRDSAGLSPASPPSGWMIPRRERSDQRPESRTCDGAQRAPTDPPALSMLGAHQQARYLQTSRARISGPAHSTSVDGGVRLTP
jgi:hypothetical protein